MAKPCVDSKPFQLKPSKWVNRKQLERELVHTIKIDFENKHLLKRINVINRNGVSYK